jgi:hypothetical protein
MINAFQKSQLLAASPRKALLCTGQTATRSPGISREILTLSACSLSESGTGRAPPVLQKASSEPFRRAVHPTRLSTACVQYVSSLIKKRLPHTKTKPRIALIPPCLFLTCIRPRRLKKHPRLFSVTAYSLPLKSGDSDRQPASSVRICHSHVAPSRQWAYAVSIK